MRLVVIESPFAGDVEKNLRYVRAAMADCLARGEAPYASHALYTQPGVLEDGKPEERALGINAGFQWARRADLVAVYCDLGCSRGMAAGIRRAISEGQEIAFRQLGGEWAASDLGDVVARAESWHQLTADVFSAPATVSALGDALAAVGSGRLGEISFVPFAQPGPV